MQAGFLEHDGYQCGLLDLMKLEVMAPTRLVDLGRIDAGSVTRAATAASASVRASATARWRPTRRSGHAIRC